MLKYNYCFKIGDIQVLGSKKGFIVMYKIGCYNFNYKYFFLI